MAARYVDPIFAAYARTAPLEDLRFSLAHARRRLAEYELPARSVALIREMVALERVLIGLDGTPALKARVGALVCRFRASIPDWPNHPWRHRYGLDRWTRRAHGRATLATLRARYVVQPWSDPFDRVRLRPVVLSDAAVAALLASEPLALGVAEAPPVRARLSWRDRALALESKLREAERRIAELEHAARPRPTRADVDWQAAGRKAWATRQARKAAAERASEAA